MRKSIPVCTAVICSLFVSLQVAKSADEKKPAEKKIEAAKVELGRPVDFESDVLPILENNCISCHNIGIDEGKLVLEEVESIIKGGKRGTAVVPKQPEKSLLFLLASRAKGPAMPPLPSRCQTRSNGCRWGSGRARTER